MPEDPLIVLLEARARGEPGQMTLLRMTRQEARIRVHHALSDHPKANLLGLSLDLRRGRFCGLMGNEFLGEILGVLIP